MESPWLQAFVSWAPFLFLIGFWIFFMRYMKQSKTAMRQRELVERTFQHYDRMEALAERTATAVERRAAN